MGMPSGARCLAPPLTGALGFGGTRSATVHHAPLRVRS